MKRVRVRVEPHPYDVIVGDGVLNAKALALVLGPSSHGVVVTSRRVASLHGTALLETLRGAGFEIRAMIELGDGERAKTIREWERTLDVMVKALLDRSSFVIAFGGGSIGDAAGFAAATFMRGVRVIQIPTTLLSMVDSSVGGKTGLNLPGGKNLVGSFHQPRLVLADLRFLKTLPERERQSGVYEILKCAILKSEPLLRLLERTSGLRTASTAETEHAVREAVATKARIVERDEKESGERAFLNLGHALGHALEAATDYRRFTHGEAVGYGLEFAADLGEGLGMTPPAVARRIKAAIDLVGPRRPIAPSCIKGAALAIRGDKKRQGQMVREIVFEKCGKPAFVDVNVDSLQELSDSWLRARSR